MSDTTSLLRHCREELAEHYDCRCELSSGNERLDLIWVGTLKSLFDRISPEGFCSTSYGEENNIRAYGVTHYPRDTAEAGRILAEIGAPRWTDLILAFTLDHIPVGQYYIPHVYRADGSIRANTIQVDTPAHCANALCEAIVSGGATSERARLFQRLNAVMDATWERHFHPEYGLLDGGNYNEQGYEGSTEALLDIFTNAAFEAGCRSMHFVASVLNESCAGRYAERAAILDDTIESRLAISPAQGYWPALRWPSGEILSELNWLPLYAHRWHHGVKERWQLMWERLTQETALDWEGVRVVTGETSSNRYKLLGKFYAVQLAYCAESGRQRELSDLLCFAAQTVKRPDNLFPEWWYHHRPADLCGYFLGFLDHYQGIWESFRNNPEGDYTVDSGNCEQSAVFSPSYMARCRRY